MCNNPRDAGRGKAGNTKPLAHADAAVESSRSELARTAGRLTRQTRPKGTARSTAARRLVRRRRRRRPPARLRLTFVADRYSADGGGTFRSRRPASAREYELVRRSRTRFALGRVVLGGPTSVARKRSIRVTAKCPRAVRAAAMGGFLSHGLEQYSPKR
ncbi:hypothetical protein EVAR_53294_1 [Eumeta japonica]|uniref:Uncharacterized protein n=1 Tax=Eumeta variegata TaxID=151549 RepID=A0A4C1YZT7_EUMVA|nr:hypothetical protein EVAR_53294_1 [Eumeta japonica]